MGPRQANIAVEQMHAVGLGNAGGRAHFYLSQSRSQCCVSMNWGVPFCGCLSQKKQYYLGCILREPPMFRRMMYMGFYSCSLRQKSEPGTRGRLSGDFGPKYLTGRQRQWPHVQTALMAKITPLRSSFPEPIADTPEGPNI